MNQLRNLVAILKVPSDVVLKYIPQEAPSNPDVSVNGILCLNWEYEGEEGSLSDVLAKQVISENLVQSLQILPTQDHSIDQISSSLSEIIKTAPLQMEPKLDEHLPNEVVQFCMADMSSDEFQNFGGPVDDLKFSISSIVSA